MEGKTYQLRSLVLGLAEILPGYFTFKELAAHLFAGGVIAVAEEPYPHFEGSKSQYLKERLSGVTGNEDFFVHVLPGIFSQLDAMYGGPDLDRLLFLCKRFGYEVHDVEQEDTNGDIIGVWRELVFPKSMPGQDVSRQKVFVGKLPIRLKSLVQQLDSNLELGHVDASALLIRRIIFLATVMSLKKQGKSPINDSGDIKELSLLLADLGASSADLSRQMQKRIQSAKWMGDDANHMEMWNASPEEVEQTAQTLSRFLRILFP